MNTMPHFLQPVSFDRALEILTNSMWSTMMITGLFFAIFLSLFLIIKVGRSISAESADVGPVEMSFILSFSGIRYLHNHVRHHLFETPLISRRRYSSLSTSWLPRILKRASFSYQNGDIFSEENGLTLSGEKGRRNSSSSSDSHTSRISSISSKSKRLSVPHIHLLRNMYNTTPKPSIQPSVETFALPKNISRRNTSPNLSISADLPLNNTNLDKIDRETSDNQVQLRNNDGTSFLIESKSLLMIDDEENIEVPISSQSNELKNNLETKLMTIIEEENLEGLEDTESIFGEIQYDISEVETDEEEDDKNQTECETALESVDSINIESQSALSQSNIDLAPPKASSFRSAYFNYLPESIFGYSTNILKSSAPELSAADGSNAPPGFSKRSASHDVTNSSASVFSNTVNDEFNNHQPLYARRRTENSKTLSETSKSFLPFNLPVFSPSLNGSDSEPNRSNTASPCLSDLQNTVDLFAPINWNFSTSDQSEALRRSWDTTEDDENFEVQSKTTARSNSSTIRQKSTFSSLFEGY